MYSEDNDVRESEIFKRRLPLHVKGPNLKPQKPGTGIALLESKLIAHRAADKGIVPTTSKTSTQAKARLRSTVFKYYIHDGVDACRFQLLGELSESEITELSGSWRTARTTLGSRNLVLDLKGVKSIDEAGKQWLIAMASEGASYVPESYLRTGLAAQAAHESAQPGFFGKLFSVFRGSRVISAESTTQAQ